MDVGRDHGAPDAALLEGDPLDLAWKPSLDTDPSHYAPAIWTTGAMAKVRPSDAPGPQHWVSLSAARNETESFQVHVRAEAPLRDLAFVVSDLHDARSGATLAASNITVSEERYHTIGAARRSDLNGLSGDIPDPLIPVKDVYFGELRKAFARTVAAGTNASAWIDVFVPPGTPSGWYTGTVTVSAAASQLAKLPILLKVWNVDLPSTASLRSAFGMTRDGPCLQEYGSVAACAAAAPRGDPNVAREQLSTLYARFALDHRISISKVVAAPPGASWTHFDAVYGPLMNGTAPTRLSGARLTTIEYRDETSAAPLAGWADHFRAQGWLDRLVYYNCDEPGGATCTFSQAKAEGAMVRAAAPAMRILLTTNLWNVTEQGLLDTVDVITPVLDHMQPHGMPSQRAEYQKFLDRSPQKRLFWYQSCDQHENCGEKAQPGPATATWASYMVDATPMRNRVFQWMAYLFAIQGELYWSIDECFVKWCGEATAMDPFASVYLAGGHGDGTLIYPGNTRLIGGTHHIPLSSIRFELIREGMEDYELLHLLDAAGEGALALAQVRSFIRRADDFDADPARLMAAREVLGDRLHARTQRP